MVNYGRYHKTSKVYIPFTLSKPLHQALFSSNVPNLDTYEGGIISEEIIKDPSI